MAFLGIGGDDKPTEVDKNRKQLLQTLTDRAGQSPYQSGSFQAQEGQLMDNLQRRRRMDASQAAARGLTGSEFEIAQASNRNQVYLDALRNMISNAEGNRFRSFQQALQAQNMSDQVQQSREAQEAANRRAWLRGLSNLVSGGISGGVQALFGGEGGE